MSLTEARIAECENDEDLFELLSEELRWRLSAVKDESLEAFVARLRKLPTGLHAMAAIHELDVSIALDDLGWHFANWHHRPYCEETLWALRELEAHEEARIFEHAYALAQPYWERIGDLLADDFDTFTEWYRGSALDKALQPLNERMWELCKSRTGLEAGLLNYWVRYARKYPHKVALLAS